MFNQKVNGYWSQNPDYLNNSLGAPGISARDIHNCGTTINKYTKSEKCGSLPLQTWCSPHVAVESFGMRPIVNSKEYFDNIKDYFAFLIYSDSVNLKSTGMSSENYNIVADYGVEPQSSFLQAINLEATDKLSYLMGESAGKVGIFSNYNPLCEGFVITDIDIDTFQSVSNPDHFVHKVLFSVFNTTRYNTISVKAQLYQDTSNMMDNWNKSINLVENSQDIESVYYIELLKERTRLEQALDDERESNRLAIRKSEDNIQQQLLDLILNGQNIDLDSRSNDPISKLVLF